MVLSVLFLASCVLLLPYFVMRAANRYISDMGGYHAPDCISGAVVRYVLDDEIRKILPK